MDIKVDLETFKKVVEQTGNRVYESDCHVVSGTDGSIVLIARKPNKKRVFRDSYPALKFGYLGHNISLWMSKEEIKREEEDKK